MSFKAKYVIFYLFCWALMYACTTTWIWVRGSDKVTIQADDSIDSLRIGGGHWDWSDDDQIGGRKSTDTIKVKDTLK